MIILSPENRNSGGLLTLLYIFIHFEIFERSRRKDEILTVFKGT